MILARRDPTAKLALLFAVSLAATFVWDPVTPAILYALALIAVVWTVRPDPRTLALAHVPFAGFALGMFVVNGLSRPGAVVWSVGPLSVTEEGLAVGASLAGRTLLIGVLATGFLLSTEPSRLMASLVRHARLSPRVAFALLAGQRMLQEMPREWHTIRAAHAVRVPAGSPGRLPRGPRHLAHAIFTLLVVSIRKGERIALALETRGLGAGPRTVRHPARLTAGDAVMAVAVAGSVSAVIAGAAWLGILAGPSALAT